MYSERIKQIRQKLDLSVAKLSKQIEIPPRTITSYEGGREPSLEFLAQLCNKLNVNANWFINGDGKMFNEQQPSENDKELEQKVIEVMKKYGIIEQ